MAHDVLDRAAASVVVVAAGFTHVDACEEEPELARAVNCEGPAVLAAQARRSGAQTVYLSTEYVFDGRQGPYDERSPTNPLSVYGTTKLDGETAVQEADPRALVVRTTIVYGPEEQGKNFAYQLADRLRRGQRLTVPSDQVSTPTYNRDLAAGIVALVRHGTSGVVHVAGPDRLSREAFARALASAADLDPELIDGVPTAELGQPAARPLSAGLVSVRAPRPGELADVRTAVADWISRPRGRRWP